MAPAALATFKQTNWCKIVAGSVAKTAKGHCMRHASITAFQSVMALSEMKAVMLIFRAFFTLLGLSWVFLGTILSLS